MCAQRESEEALDGAGWGFPSSCVGQYVSLSLSLPPLHSVPPTPLAGSAELFKKEPLGNKDGSSERRGKQRRRERVSKGKIPGDKVSGHQALCLMWLPQTPLCFYCTRLLFATHAIRYILSTYTQNVYLLMNISYSVSIRYIFLAPQ